MMKNTLLLFLALLIFINSNGQQSKTDSLMPFTTSLKLNLNGFRIGVEQKITRTSTVQLEIGRFRKETLILSPQIRIYKRVFRVLGFIGAGYLYKKDGYNAADSVHVIGSGPDYLKSFRITKYVHAFTLNSGFFFDAHVFKRTLFFEFNFAAGIRYKKSNLYGLEPNEEIDFVGTDAYILRPQHEQNTKGKFVLYPEINGFVRLIIPLIK
ncbi:MAG: hypothetical protein ABI480_07365 [Chitinophagaceae bacterium]